MRINRGWARGKTLFLALLCVKMMMIELPSSWTIIDLALDRGTSEKSDL